MAAKQENITGTGEGPRGPVNRRTALTAFGVVSIGLAGTPVAKAATSSGASPGAQPSVATGTTAACVLTPEETEGPYYLSYEMVRRDITEGYPGVPLVLNVAVLDTSTCAPLPGAALDIWHCNALGEYSGYTSQGIGGGSGSGTGTPPAATPSATPRAIPTGTPPAGGGHVGRTDNLTFLRGVQLTDHRGLATFRTVYPGWYNGRAIHIHVKVHIGGKVTARKTYTGGHVSHTGQLYFPEAFNTAVGKLKPYDINTVTRLLNADDTIFTGGKDSGLLTLTPLRHQDPSHAHGLSGSIVLGVNPSATPAAVGN